MNQRNFFRDRHYLDREFPVLLQPGMVMLEVLMSFSMSALCPQGVPDVWCKTCGMTPTTT